MIRILYIYPHPDDESFGPASVMHKQRREGHEVHLLTLTRGGATRQRLKLGLSVEEMGAVRAREMEKVAQILDLSGMTILDLPDSGLKELDPRVIGTAVRKQIAAIQPDVVVTYPVHGISGFHDHLVTHAVVKQVFCEMRSGEPAHPRRLAFLALRDTPDLARAHFRLQGTADADIDCVIRLSPDDLRAHRDALRAYTTYADVVAKTGIIERIQQEHCFDLFGEQFDPPLMALDERLP